MDNENVLVILCRDQNGKFKRQIKLGEDFISDVNNMTSQIDWIGSRTEQMRNDNRLLNWKVNSLISNRIMFNCKGIDFSLENNESSLHEKNQILRVIEGISDGLFALIDDFMNKRESGDPKVFRDHIMLLFAIYRKIKMTKTLDNILSDGQREMVESQFDECINLFNKSMNQAIANNDWRIQYNNMSAFFGGCYGYMRIDINSQYLKDCIIDTEESTIKVEHKDKNLSSTTKCND